MDVDLGGATAVVVPAVLAGTAFGIARQNTFARAQAKKVSVRATCDADKAGTMMDMQNDFFIFLQHAACFCWHPQRAPHRSRITRSAPTPW